MKTLTMIALAVSVLSSCQKECEEMEPSTSQTETSSGTSSTGKVAVTRPFVLNVVTSADQDPSVPLTPCSGDLPGFATPGQFLSGTASHLGQLNPSLSRLQDVSCNLSFTSGYLTTHIEGQMAASNGDLIYYTCDDSLNVINLLTGAPELGGTIIGTWTITGGTGRFEGATGSFDISGPVNFATTSFSFIGTGTITY